MAGKNSIGNQHTEYGGGPGTPQRLPDGSDKRLTPGEAARVTRIEAINTAGIVEHEGQTEAELSEHQRRREEVLRRNNGYSAPVGDV